MSLVRSGIRVGSVTSCSRLFPIAKASAWRPKASVREECLSYSVLWTLKSPVIMISDL